MDSLEAYWTYLVSCSQSLIQDHGYWTSEGQKGRSLQDIVMVKLSRLLLKNLDQIGSCRSLRICILSDNFLTRIEAVMECTRLVKLDLKGNQVFNLFVQLYLIPKYCICFFLMWTDSIFLLRLSSSLTLHVGVISKNYNSFISMTTTWQAGIILMACLAV